MTLGQLRRLHTRNIGLLITRVHDTLPGYELQLEEGFINPVRHYKKSKSTLTQAQYVHSLKGNHPKGTANDISLFVNGKYISRSDDPLWIPVVNIWLSLHEYCRSGISGDDANHFSTAEDNRW